MRPHGRARVNPHSPEAWAVCDKCNFLYNHNDLSFQYEWFGPRLQTQNMLVCEQCLDVPQEQLRTIVLPADPQPIDDPRPERYTVEMNPFTSIGENIGTMTNGGGVAAAFDGETNRPIQTCAQLYTSAAGYNNSVGKYWYDIQPITANRFVAIAPNNAPFLGSGACNYKFQGGDLTVAMTDLYTGTTAGTVGETIDVDITPTTSYLYHQIVFEGDGATAIAIAQLKIYTAG